MIYKLYKEIYLILPIFVNTLFRYRKTSKPTRRQASVSTMLVRP